MISVVLNRKIGGRFRLSDEAWQLYRRTKELTIGPFGNYVDASGMPQTPVMVNRSDPVLVAIVAKLGIRASGDNSDLMIVEISKEHENKFFIELNGYEKGVELMMLKEEDPDDPPLVPVPILHSLTFSSAKKLKVI